MLKCPSCKENVAVDFISDTFSCLSCHICYTGEFLRLQLINRMYKCCKCGSDCILILLGTWKCICCATEFVEGDIRGNLIPLLQNQNSMLNQTSTSMKSDPCDSPTRDVRKVEKNESVRVQQLSSWNSRIDSIIAQVEEGISCLTIEDRKQIKVRLDSVLKILYSK